MDLETVRVCFQKYVSYLEKNEKVTLPENTSIDQVSISEMDKLTQTLFMDYVMKNEEKINQTAIPCVLYKHVNTLIQQYIEKNPQFKEQQNKKKKGWFW